MILKVLKMARDIWRSTARLARPRPHSPQLGPCSSPLTTTLLHDTAAGDTREADAGAGPGAQPRLPQSDFGGAALWRAGPLAAERSAHLRPREGRSTERRGRATGRKLGRRLWRCGGDGDGYRMSSNTANRRAGITNTLCHPFSLWRIRCTGGPRRTR